MQLFFSLWFSVFFVTHFFNLLLISFGFLFLLIWFLSFSGTSHSFFKFFFFFMILFIPFFLHLFWFFIFSFFIFLIWHESKLIYFPSSHFSSQQKKNSFSFLHFFISPTKHIWGKLRLCLVTVFVFYFQKLVFGNIKKKQFSYIFEIKNMFG